MNGETSLAAGRWRIDFARGGDRLAHAISWCPLDGEPLLFVSSREGAGDENWPSSPPLQELHVERRSDDLTVALLVGMAGSSHWSLVVEAHARAERLVFEAACRVHTAPERLGSTYELGAACTCIAVEDASALRIAASSEAWRIESESVGDLPQAELLLDAQGRCLTLSPALARPKHAHTIRWRYWLALSE